MLGWRLINEREIALEKELGATRVAFLSAELRQLKEYVAKCERLIDHERNRVSAEQERADRATDALLQQNGTPAITATGRRELEEVEAERKDAEDTYLEQMAEISRDTFGTTFDELGVEIPQSLIEDAKELMTK